MLAAADSKELYAACSPDRDNLCLYGHPDGNWSVDLPVEEVPPELPEPVLGINFARDGGQGRAGRKQEEARGGHSPTALRDAEPARHPPDIWPLILAPLHMPARRNPPPVLSFTVGSQAWSARTGWRCARCTATRGS